MSLTSLYDATWKVIFLGDSGVGKTTYVRVLSDPSYVFSEQPASTVQPDVKQIPWTVGRNKVAVNLWDTAGQEVFRALTAAYFRSTNGVVAVFDITSPTSLARLRGMLQDSALLCPEALTLVVGNKTDLSARRAVTKAEGEALAKEYNAVYFETSMSDADGARAALDALVTRIADRSGLGRLNTRTGSRRRGAAAEGVRLGSESSGGPPKDTWWCALV
eukprot:m.23283 g.23283  ORF g.23283 m.23283 type:complete len:218 (+) comp8463_c0_seq1:55-708(+)